MILAINTSTPQFSLALVEENGALLAEWTLSPRTKDFRHFMTALDHLLQTSGVALEEIRGLAVAGDDEDQVPRQRPARRIKLPLFVRPDVALEQRIAQSLAVDFDLGAAGL